MLSAAARARGRLLLRRGGGGTVLHACSKADDSGGTGRRGDEGERLLLVTTARIGTGQYPGGLSASAAGFGVDGASHAAGGGGGGGGDPGGGAGAATALCTMEALGPATSQGSNPMGAWLRA